ncbi:MAG: acyl--CoA ligase, partial [Deltaproteobacteria bacterium]|nr:acyl--CoA ligase [Deltaproteobacteria bacterium]
EHTMKANTLFGWLEHVAQEHGSKTAITFLRHGQVETEMSFAQLRDDATQFAATLRAGGVKKGDRVILLLAKSIFAVVAHFAIQAIGAIGVPLNPGFKKNELEYLITDAGASLIILSPEKKSLVQAINPEMEMLEVMTSQRYQELTFFKSAPKTMGVGEGTSEDPALIIYTSGTTGSPKGTILTHKNLLHDACNIMHTWEITSDDVLCHVLPLFHVHGLCFALQTLLLRGAHVRMLDQFVPEIVATELSRSTGDAVCSVFMAVPAMYTRLIDYLNGKYLDFSHMRLLTSGSAPLLPKEFRRVSQVFGMEPVEREGMSETGMNFSNPLQGKRIPGSIGKPLPGLQVKIVDPKSFTEIAPGKVGELWLKSPSITTGYWGKPEETADTFKNGWFRTGDLGRVDANGYYYLTDRIKHIIISGGENISAKEVEATINQLDGVDESVVVGKADEKWGERVVAAVKLKPGAKLTDGDVKDYCKSQLHNWKCPKELIFLDMIPRNTMGKVLKEDVKKLFV